MSEIYYHISDQDGHFVDKFTFQRLSGNWIYVSSNGYVFGSILSPTPNGTIEKLLDYLTSTNEKLGFKKRFSIVPISSDQIYMESKVCCESLLM